MIEIAQGTNIFALRPGLIGGLYPERSDSSAQGLEAFFSNLQGKLARLTSKGDRDLQAVARTITALGEPLASMDDAGLADLLITLRRSLASQGLTDPLCQQAFALIREIASRQLGQRPYAAQLMGGWVMLQGQLAEMATGEGKTLTATLPAATAALAGIPVHLITANEYLVQRDAQAMGPLYRALGLSVGFVTQEMSFAERKAGYSCDITYCTNKQVAFDYLRDRLLRTQERGALRQRLQAAADGRKLLLRGLCFAIVDEADHVLIDEARTPLILTRTLENTQEKTLNQQAFSCAQGLKAQRDFILEAKSSRVRLTTAGHEQVSLLFADNIVPGRRQRRLLELVEQALFGLHCLERDRDYLVQEDRVVIIDANTGRTMADRSWERGLQQLVELKEGCPQSEAREQLGRLTYQSFFRRYLHLGGMSGTVAEVENETRVTYGLRVRTIALHRPSQRKVLPAKTYVHAQEKWQAVIAEIKLMRQQGRPVLVGTGSVADSELLSQRLQAAGLPHQVLNARQDAREAEIVAIAGKKGQVTIATNMAGRGTDIPLGPGVAELGGLHVIATCCNESARIDRQLIGRCARQGDPGSCRSLLSLEDQLIQVHGSSLRRGILRSWLGALMPQGDRCRAWVLQGAQSSCERVQRKARQNLLQSEEAVNRLLAFSGEAL